MAGKEMLRFLFKKPLFAVFLISVLIHISLSQTLFVHHFEHAASSKNGFHLDISDVDDLKEVVPPAQQHESHERVKREAAWPSNHGLPSLTRHALNDSRTSAFISWAGLTSDIVVLTKGSSGSSDMSKLYVSTNYGVTYTEIAQSTLRLGSVNLNIDKMYHLLNDDPSSAKHYIFTDKVNKAIVRTLNLRTFSTVSLSFTPEEVIFHPTLPNILLAKGDDELWVSTNTGYNWRKLASDVVSYYWETDDGLTVLAVVEVNVFGSTRKDLKQYGVYTYGGSTLQTNFDTFQRFNQFYFLTRPRPYFSISGSTHMDLYVSKNASAEYERAEFPWLALTHNEYLVIDVERDRVMICVTHNTNATHLYVSDVTGTKYTLSLPNIVYYSPTVIDSPWMRYISEKPFADIHKVGGLRGIYIASQWLDNSTSTSFLLRNQTTRITYDKGGIWSHLLAPYNHASGSYSYCSWYTGCTLHLIQKFHQGVTFAAMEPILSSENAPGIILAEGTMGWRIENEDFGLFLSTDAGFTWKEVAEGDQLFAIGDHGNFIVYAESRKQTNFIKYSIDEGNTWQRLDLNQTLIIYGVLTKPGSETGLFSLWGSLPAAHSWVIMQLNLTTIYPAGTICNSTNYKLWSPGLNITDTEICLLGETDMVQRKKAEDFCFNGVEFERITFNQTCKCKRVDYECDYGFERDDEVSSVWTTEPQWFDQEVSNCTNDPSVNMTTQAIPADCPYGTTYNISKGYRKIAGDTCDGGDDHLYEPILRNCPRDSDQKFLIYSVSNNLYRLYLDESSSIPHLMVYHGSSNEIFAVEYDYNNNILYWADSGDEGAIRYRNYSSGASSYTQTLISNDIGRVDSMALDWESGNLYIVDPTLHKQGITVISVNKGWRRTLVHNNITDPVAGLSSNTTLLVNPRAIDVVPSHGIMFWTDWDETNPRIMNSSMTGYNISVFYENRAHLYWPNGLAVDVDYEQVYFIDGFQHKLMRINFNGGGFTIILNNPYQIKHPFALDIFRDRVYWSDWTDNSIKSVLKDTGFAYYVAKQSTTSRISALKTVHYDAQYITNGTGCGVTSNGLCSNLCLPHPIDTASPPGKHNNRLCLCPDYSRPNFTAYVGNENGCNCSAPEIFNHTTGYCVYATGHNCSSSQFRCASGDRCIPSFYQCDNDNDCGDLSDEMNCDSIQCTADQYACPGQPKCIPKRYICDHDPDCLDGSDEHGCPPVSCPSGQFKCDSNHCIPGSWECDGMVDCGGEDNSDERNCTLPTTVSSLCLGSQVPCLHGGGCIFSSWVCDGYDDCFDGSDELNCTTADCESYEFKCVTPGTGNKCVYEWYKCDGDNDCSDGSDEFGCNHTTTRSTTIPFVPSTNPSTCFRCFSNNKLCVDREAVCDRVSDCPDGSDEYNCGYSTTPAIRTTTSSCVQYCDHRCLHLSDICDGYHDCTDGSDERNCEVCPSPQQPCPFDTSSCIYPSQICDGRNDCPQGRDELHCSSSTLTPLTTNPSGCGNTQFQCGDRSCISRSSLCDGRWDCQDGRDEDKENCQVSNAKNLTIISKTSTSVYVSWKVDSATAQTFTLQYRLRVDIQQPPTVEFSNGTNVFNQTTANLTQLNPFSNYEIRIAVYHTSGSPKFSNTVYFVTNSGTPGPVGNLQVNKASIGTWSVSWSFPSNPNGIITGFPIIVVDAQSNRTLYDQTISSHPKQRRFIHDVSISLRKLGYGFHHTIMFKVAARTASTIGNWTTQLHCSDVEQVNITDGKPSNDSVQFMWRSEVYGLLLSYVDVDGITVKKTYAASSVNNTVIISGLSPGRHYIFTAAFSVNDCHGNSYEIGIDTTGEPIPKVDNVTAANVTSNSAKITWDKLSQSKSYEVLLSYSKNDMLNGKYEVEEQVSGNFYDAPGLYSCQQYTYAARSFQPRGPRSQAGYFHTLHDPFAEPRNLAMTVVTNVSQAQVYQDPFKTAAPTNVKVNFTWDDPCVQLTNQANFYVVSLNLLECVDCPPDAMKNTIYPNASSPVSLTVQRGGVYWVTVKNNRIGSRTTTLKQIVAPYRAPLIEFSEREESRTQSYIAINITDPYPNHACWTMLYYKNSSGSNWINEATKKTCFNVNLYPNYAVNGPEYKVEARYVRFDSNGQAYFGLPNTQHFHFNRRGAVNQTSSKRSRVGVYVGSAIGAFVVIVLVAALAVFCVKHRRLQRSFANFTSSRYNANTGNATFDDDDSPMIQGFADDEPLVVA